MARIRTIKPEFWTDPDVVACSMAARLFFIGCWNHADDYGVLKDEPDRIRLQVMPADEVDACAIVDELVERRLLVRMDTPDGTPVLVVRTFLIHQKIDRRSVGRYGDPSTFIPAESRPIPPSPTSGREGRGGEWRGKVDTPPADASVVVSETAIDKRNESKAQIDALFDRFWDEYPRREGKKGAREKFAKALRGGVDPERIIAAASAYRDLPGREPRYTKHATTWLNNGCWDDELTPRTEGTVVDRNRVGLRAALETPQASFKERMAAAAAIDAGHAQHEIGGGR